MALSLCLTVSRSVIDENSMGASQDASTLIALLYGPDQRGLVARVSGWIFERGGNIIHADQHTDADYGIFFQRVEWRCGPGREAQEEVREFEKLASDLGMKAQVQIKAKKLRVALLASQHVHTSHELILDWQHGDLPGDLVAMISNHTVLQSAAEQVQLPFHYLPVTAENKVAVEREQLRMLKELRVDLVVLARYMQILSADFLSQVGCPVINIHHSFLPAFAGAKPYHQAHRRGVKVIGATAHYVTPVLDAGPIIHQDVRHVSHRDTVNDLLRLGRDLEKLVLSEAVRLHLEHRVLVYENKTVVFD
jgi:formyltetrahydrofolate deformylase